MDRHALSPISICTTKAGLAAGTTTTLTAANASIYSIRGVAYSKAAASNAATPTTDAATGAAFTPVAVGNVGVFLVGFSAAGNLSVLQGGQTALSVSGNVVTAPQFPSAMPDDFCAVGYIVTRVTSSGAAWTFGTSNLAGPPTGVVHTFGDLMTVPGRPVIA